MTTPAIVTHLAHFIGAGDEAAERATALACLATQAGHVCADLDRDAGWGPWAADMDAAARAAFRERLSGLAIVGGADDWTPLVWDGRRLYLRRYWNYERLVAEDMLARSKRGDSLDLITGGPGTGKTTSLARIIGELRAGNPSLRIALAAPTGKAAARMTEALQAAGVFVDGGAQTVHRLLGVRADGSSFHHHRDRPLAVDVLVIDEASMIDLSLMAHLLDALPATARLILLGDRDQLAAVEAGAVFADLCESPRLAESVTLLTTSYRFGGASGIGRLAERLRSGDAEAAAAILKAGGSDVALEPREELRTLGAQVKARYQPYLDGVAAGRPVADLFELFGRFRVLCAHRQDVAVLNRCMTGEMLRPDPGTPLMVLRNDPLLRVFNGDIGLVLPDPEDGQHKCCFPGGSGSEWRWIPLQRLSDWEPAWAMTVHKSQGSEFDAVLLVLPAADSRVTTRELVYTGITRAKRSVTLCADEAVLRAAIERRAERMSGLRERLR